MNNSDWYTVYSEGITKYQLGKDEDAIKDYDDAIQLKPDYAEAYYNRGNVKARLGKDEDAIKDYDKAIQLKPDYAEAYDDRGNSKAQLGKHEDAIKDYDKAIQLKPDYVNAIVHRSTSLIELNIKKVVSPLANASDIAKEFQANMKTFRIKSGVFLGVSGLIFTVIVILMYMMISADSYFTMSLMAHINIYLNVTPLTLLDIWVLFQYSKNEKLMNMYRHKHSVAMSISALRNEFFNLEHSGMSEEAYREYREFGLKQYNELYSFNNTMPQKITGNISKDGIKCSFEE